MSKDSPVTQGQLAARLVGFIAKKSAKSARLVTSKVGEVKTETES